MSSPGVGEGAVPSGHHDQWLKPASGRHTREPTGWLARMASKNPSQSFLSGSSSHGGPAAKAPYLSQRGSVGPTWAQRSLDHLSSNFRPGLYSPGELLVQRDHMAATRLLAAGGYRNVAVAAVQSLRESSSQGARPGARAMGAAQPGRKLCGGAGGGQPLLSRPVKPWPAFLSLGRWLWSTGEAGSKPPAAAFSERKKAPWLLYRMRFQRLAMGWFRLNENLRDTPEQGLADFLSNGPDSKYFTL